jgi:DNA topoisomerase-2
MLLVNGARGIGTGYSTEIPPCNPSVLKDRLLKWLNGDDNALKQPLQPFFAGVRGTIQEDGTVRGVYKKEKDEIVITEITPGYWTQPFREWLEKELTNGNIKEYTDTSTDTDVNIRIRGATDAWLEKAITDKVKTTNMHAFNHKGVITKYDTLNDILIEYANVRLGLYEKRRQQQIKSLKDELPYLVNVMRFIQDQISDKPAVDLRKKSRNECDAILLRHKYQFIDETYDYILKLPVSTFTAEMITKYQKQLEELKIQISKLETAEAADLWIHDLQQV